MPNHDSEKTEQPLVNQEPEQIQFQDTAERIVRYNSLLQLVRAAKRQP